MTESLKHKYQTEIDRLDEEHADLERSWTRVPWFTLVALLAPMAGFVWGWGAAVVELLVSGALVGTQAYLIAVRKTENRWTRGKLVDDLRAHLDEQAVPSLRSLDAPGGVLARASVRTAAA